MVLPNRSEAYSEVGRGTTVRLYLVRATTDVIELPSGGDTQIPQGEGETVLVVEDDPTVPRQW
jgi:hypothetical protein